MCSLVDIVEIVSNEWHAVQSKNCPGALSFQIEFELINQRALFHKPKDRTFLITSNYLQVIKS